MLSDRNTINQDRNSSVPEYAGLSLGVYGDYQLNNYFGIVADLALDNRTFDIIPRTKLSYVSLSPKIKFDVNGSYNQGFYIKSGFRYSILTSAETTSGTDVKDAFNNSAFSLNFGIGTNFSNFLGLEIIVDHSLTNAVEANIKSKMLGAYALVTIDLQKLINK
jgi:hypothetical protein